MTGKEKFNCPHLYRKPGKDTAHCKKQSESGAKWDFCKYQYLCRGTKRYEVTSAVKHCTLRGSD